mgnify:CR=1 FL=1
MSDLSHYLLHLADNALILGQRNAEWCGHGPILEEDLAMANQSLDLIGQARLLYPLVSELRQDQSTEDTLAYFRDADAFLNFTLLELPHHTALVPSARANRDYAVTIVRNFLFSSYMGWVWQALQAHDHPTLAAMAVKSLKETRYHLQHSADWLCRFGDGTEESHARAQAALDFLMPYTQEWWSDSVMNLSVIPQHKDLESLWQKQVLEVVNQAGLVMPSDRGHLTQGILGVHSEHMTYLLAEMQSLARMHPGAQW